MKIKKDNLFRSMLKFNLVKKINNIGEEVSYLQYQLRELLPSLTEQARQLKDPEAKKRYYLIRAVAFSAKDVKKVCESRGESTSSFYKWAKRLLNAKSLEALKSLPRKPLHSPNKLDPRIEKRICRIRRKEPYKGPEQIVNDLVKKGHKVIPHPSTVYQVLLRNDFIKDEYKKSLTKKHMKRYRRPEPGYLQMDFKYVPYAVEDKQYYQLSCVDHHSSWRLIRSYKNKDIKAVESFLDELEKICPFKIKQIQTDNDKAFTDKYRIGTDGLPSGSHPLDAWCTRRDIEHKLIPIGKKELNGKVENTHRWDDRELFSQINPKNYKELESKTIKHNERWNNLRATKALGWRTPSEVIYAYYFTRRFFNLWYGEQGENDELMQNRHSSKKSKQEKWVDRYMKYMDWESNQRLNVSLMSPNYSQLELTIRAEL